MSTQIEIDKKLTKYLQEIGYRSDKIIDELVAETLALGNVARMQIAPEQGQFLEIIVKISQAKNCLEIGRFTGLSSLCIAKGLPDNGKLVAIDNSDEFNCSVLILPKDYDKTKPPSNEEYVSISQPFNLNRTDIRVTITILNVNDIREDTFTIILRYKMTIKWIKENLDYYDTNKYVI